MKRKSSFKIFKVMKSMSKTIVSYHHLSSILNDKFWRFHIDSLVPNTTIECTIEEKKSNSNNTLLQLLGIRPEKLWF